MRDPYKVLGLGPEASKDTIKTTYRALMKVHHPDMGGDAKQAMEIDAAYKQLIAMPIRGEVAHRLQPGGVMIRGKYLELALLDVSENIGLTCPRDCSFYGRICRYKQVLSVEGADPYTLRATQLTLRARSLVDYPQTIDLRNGRGVVIDQEGDFYHCQTSCSSLHPPKFKEAAVEMFGGTQASICLWYPQLAPGRFLNRFVFKHRVLARDAQGQFWDEELYETMFSSQTFRKK